MNHDEFAAYPSVRNYIADLTGKGLNEAERLERLAVLEQFCDFVGRNPEQMIDEIFDVETQKYRKRNFYTEQVKQFSAQISGGWSAQTARGNIIRGFFIANGRRLPNEKPAWL